MHVGDSALQKSCRLLAGSLRLGQDWQKSLPATSSSTKHVGLSQWDGTVYIPISAECLACDVGDFSR